MPSPEPEPAPSPAPSPVASPAPRAAVSTLSEYRTYLAKELPASADYAYVPKIRFGDCTADENRAISRYFGMELIAYPENQKFYVYIDPDQSLFSKSSDFEYMKNFSNRVIYRSSPFFDALGREAEKRHGLAANTLVVAQLLKPSSAGYFAWKEVESARRAGVKIEDVVLCEAAFARTPFGAWIVKVETLVLKDGSRRAVEDFEWARVTTGGGR